MAGHTMPHDLNQAVALMETMKHWTIKSVNRKDQRRSYECTLWADGRRVSAQSKTPLAAVTAAIGKLQPTSKLRVIG